MRQMPGDRNLVNGRKLPAKATLVGLLGMAALTGVLPAALTQFRISPIILVIGLVGILSLAIAWTRLHDVLYFLIASLPLSGVFVFPFMALNIKVGDILAFLSIWTLVVKQLISQRILRLPNSHMIKAFFFFFFTQTLSLASYSLIALPGAKAADWGGIGLNAPYLHPLKQLMWALYSFMVLLSVYSVIDDQGKLRKAINVLFLSTVAASVYALAQLILSQLGFAARVQGYYWEEGVLIVPRIQGTAVEAGLFANLLMFVIPISICTFISHEYVISKTINFLGLLVMLMALVLTFSTIGWILLALGIVVILVIPGRRRMLGSRWRFLTHIAAIAVLILIAAQLLVPSFLEGIVATLISKFSQTSASFVERSIWASIGLKMFADYPVVGVGIGNYGNLFFRYVPHNLPKYFHHSYTAGNLYILTLAETGIIGLIGLALFIISILSSFYRSIWTCKDRYFYTVLVGALTSILSYVAFQFTNGNLYILQFWVFLGISLSALRLSRNASALDRYKRVCSLQREHESKGS